MTRATDPVDEVAWVTPSYDLGRIAWDEFERLFDPAVERYHKTEHWIKLKNGHRLTFRSADNAVSLRGRGYGLMMVDEGTWIPTKTYDNEMQATLSDRDGDLVVFTTPAGRRGWVYEEFQRAIHKERGYGCLQRPSTDNPNPAIVRWVARRRTKMAPTAFDQEILAQFVEDAQALFRGLDQCIGGVLEKPTGGAVYVVGLDLAKTHDWTVVVVLRIDQGLPYQVVAFDRFHRADWPDQVRRVAHLVEQYHNAVATVDATAVGDPVCSMLREAGVVVKPFIFNVKTRKALLDQLAIGIAQTELRIPQALIDDVLGEELRSFAVDLDEEGRTKYRSRGAFDDAVMAMALAWWGAPREGEAHVIVGEVEEHELGIMNEEY